MDPPQISYNFYSHLDISNKGDLKWASIISVNLNPQTKSNK